MKEALRETTCIPCMEQGLKQWLTHAQDAGALGDAMSIFGRAKSALDLLSTVAVTAAAGFLIWSLTGGRASPGGAPASPGSTVQRITGTRIDATTITNVLGEGRVAIVEFSDFECPFCARYAQDVFPVIRRTLVESGRARYIAFHFPLERIHPRAVKASEAAECAGRQGRFWEMHDLLFADGLALPPDQLADRAEALGVDRARFETCVAGEALEKVRADQSEGRRLGVTGTPMFFLGIVRDDRSIDLVRRINGLVSAEVFEAEVGELAAGLPASLRTEPRVPTAAADRARPVAPAAASGSASPRSDAGSHPRR